MLKQFITDVIKSLDITATESTLLTVLDFIAYFAIVLFMMLAISSFISWNVSPTDARLAITMLVISLFPYLAKRYLTSYIS